MDQSTTTIYNAARWAICLAAVPGFLYSAWVVMRGVLDGLPAYQAMAWGAWTLVAIALLLRLLYAILDRWYEHRPDALEARAAAKILRGLHATKHEQLLLFAVFEVWMGENKSTGVALEAVRNTRWRVLKQGVNQGFLPAELNGEHASKRTTCKSKDAARFFESGAWRKVKLKDD